MIPKLLAFSLLKEETTVQVYEGFKGVQTCFGHYLLKLKKGKDIIVGVFIPSKKINIICSGKEVM